MRTALMLLWHMHQPFYKDLAEGVYAMPWARLHALKDYFGMAAVMRDFPNFHATFNLVPSLVEQLQEYAQDQATERNFAIAYKPAAQLAADERAHLLVTAFQINRENLLDRYPRFRELADKAEAADDRALAARLFTLQELIDLQVLSELAWFDEIYLAQDPVVARLVAKGRGYSEEDKVKLRAKEIELLKVTLEEYGAALERGQIEVSTSPFYHPILPLLCDSNIAAESHPAVELPRRPFRHPEDARAQLRGAVELHERVFGRRPKGLWPSEGSVSDDVLRLAAEEGFTWAATDEGVLARTLGSAFHRNAEGTVAAGADLYRPHRFESEGKAISLFFRDHQLSDLIGFVYSHMDPHAAAADLHERIRAAARSAGERPAVVSIILDGENAWEFYRGNGREFLKSFYARISGDREIQALTGSEALAFTEQGRLSHVVPGSWINANFDIWIGAEEDNRAWDLLGDARDFCAERLGGPGVDAAKAELAQRELFIAEGSDWCWWYGPEHSSAHDEEFDLLYRKHLSNVYRLLGASPPDDLAEPVKRPRGHALVTPPTGRLEPRVDGEITNYFEWLGAGLYMPDYRTSSMHGAAEYLEALYYGFNERALYLRLDFRAAFLAEHRDFEIRINIGAGTRVRLHAPVKQGKLAALELWKSETRVDSFPESREKVQVGFGRIFEARLDLDLLGLRRNEKANLQVALWANDLPVQVIPSEGWLTLELTENFVVW